MKIRGRRLASSLLLSTTLAGAVSAPVLADHEAPRLGLAPIGEDGQFFDLTLQPGETADLQLEIASFGHEDVQARTYAADAYSIINGGFGAELFGEPGSGATRWIDYPTKEVMLGRRDALVIDFSVTVPTGTLPGEYITSVVAENIHPYSGATGSIALEQVNRTAIAVAVEVPGRKDPALAIGSVAHKASGGTSFVTFEVANTGNVHLKPRGRFILRDTAANELATVPALMDSVYAGSATQFEAPLGEALVPGEYCADLSLTDEETGAADAVECLPFTVEAPVPPPLGPDVGSMTIPIIQPAIEAAVGNPPAAALVVTALLALLGA
ncbi:MAG: DUF916 domain-containing protein, partial [Chloroflexota bacterium]|nr:DUF916 domain-containing protein [Chloroflexota bacterium]